MAEIFHRLNSRISLAKFLPASLLGVFVGIWRRALVDESGMIKIQMATYDTVDQILAAVHGTHCSILPLYTEH
jgi:hypothetical protein